jgi:hypothetical protein
MRREIDCRVGLLGDFARAVIRALYYDFAAA